MNPLPLDQARDPDAHHIEAALRRAAQTARKIAVQTNTPLVVVRDGQVLEIPAQEIKMTDANQPPAQ